MIAIALPHFTSNLTVILGRDSLPQYAPSMKNSGKYDVLNRGSIAVLHKQKFGL